MGVCRRKVLLVSLFSTLALAHRLRPRHVRRVLTLRGGEDEYDDEEDYDEEEYEVEEGTQSMLDALWERYGRPVLRRLTERTRVARERALREQYIEDFNARQAMAGLFVRACMILPIDDMIDPPSNGLNRDKLQLSDRCFMSQSVSNFLMERRIEVPWQFQIKTIGSDVDEAPQFDPEKGRSVYCSPLDFRAPENHIFVPKWMMKHLKVQPFDLVLLTWVRLRDGVSITLRPRQKSFHQLPNPRVALESELKYYSSATASTLISIRHNDKDFDFHVDSCVGKDGASIEFNPEVTDAVSIQDADVSLDLVT